MPALDLEHARALLWEAWPRGPVVRRPLLQAQGLVLAEDLRSDRPFPPYARITMDGFAARAADIAAASAAAPVRLRVVGEAVAGRAFAGTLGTGQATKAMTGAPLPAGADCVVRVEDTAGFRDDWAEIRVAVAVGTHVAQVGEDLRAGDVIVGAGTCLRSQHVQVLASAGHAHVPVIDPPRAGVLSTGDELVAMDAKPGEHQIRESNNACARAVLAELGVACADLGLVRDDLDALVGALRAALAQHELLVITGGVSQGERDLVKPALRACGVQLRFESLNLRPGHPATFGVHANGVVFALPGNPVAVFATLVMVFSAALRRRLGYLTAAPQSAHAVLARAVVRKGGRPWLLPVTLAAPSQPGLPVAQPVEHHGSGDFVSLARCDALAWLPASRERFEPGTPVEIVRLPAWFGA